jgi:formylglycine-generating enzyme required for sulfatase activity
MKELIEAELAATGSTRVVPPTPEEVAEAAKKAARKLDPKEDFMRMLRLSGLDGEGITDDQRDAFINVAENLGLNAGDAEDMVDLYLEEIDDVAPAPVPKPVVKVAPKSAESPAPEPAAAVQIDVAGERMRFPRFNSTIGAEMLLVPSGTFQMGNDDGESAPNEKPVTPVTVSRFYMSRHPITNAQYEMFDRSHARKRAPGTSERHPVVYVSSVDAAKFCQWLSAHERRRYRLPTEAEWEYAARGTDGRKYPWGSQEGRGDLANFADRNTVFAWSDHEIDDGFAESSPVGAFPVGASPFGLEDMAGNVWEWCSDFLEPYRGTPKTNPRGPSAGTKKVYRGGSWKSRFNSLRATTRSANVPNYSCNDLGFRIVCECE